MTSVFVLGFLGYDKYVKQHSDRNAMNDMYTAQKYYNDAVLGTSQDSLFNISLNGADGKYGMLDIIDNYSGTDAANLANYYAGMAYLNMKDYANAITYLNAFSSNDDILGPMAKGGIGDAFVQLEQLEDAYDYYLQAAESKANNFTRPMYLQKAGVIGLKIGKNKQSLEHFNTIKNDFPDSMEAKDVDVFIGKAQALSN